MLLLPGTMMETDTSLLQRYLANRDAEAFSQIVQRHAAMVFATARRVTGSVHDAEDVTQACFLDLARNAARVHRSLGGYLYSSATHRALNAVRDAVTRHRHEQAQAAESARVEQSEPTWEEIAPYVDAALAELDGELREPLVLHFLQGKTHAQTATELGVSRPTVTRRIEAGVEALRARLQQAGLAVSLAGLASVLAQPADAALPAELSASLGKLAMAGAGPQGIAASAAWWHIWAAQTGVKVGMAAGLALVLAVLLQVRHSKSPAAQAAAHAAPATVLTLSETGTKGTGQTMHVRREGNRVWVDGVPRLQWGKSGMNTYTGSLHAAMAGMGETYTYEQLMVYSGMAFRLRWGRSADGKGWNGSAPIGELSDVDYPPITGWQLRWAAGFPGASRVNELVAAIDAGRPVLGYVTGEWDMGLVYGYEDGGRRLLIQDYYFDGEGPNLVPPSSVHDLVAFFDKKTAPLSPHDALLDGLRRGAEFWRMGTVDVQKLKNWEPAGRGFFYYGPDAYRQWRTDLAAADGLTQAQLGNLRHHNWWIGDSMRDGRRAAASALAKLAPALRNEQARSELLLAADAYTALASLCDRKLAPCLVGSAEQFTPQIRQTCHDVLEEVERLDGEAIAHVARAVELEAQ
jgi:RNA polymerase sigma factor (sigma-70 family)